MKNSYTKINLITIVIVLFVSQTIETFFQFQWNKVRIMELLINNPSLYTPLLTYYYEIN
jgi:hypothetical protein